ncbi:MAG: DUF4418 family protein [Ruminococcus sp.]|nr:DUF4418 family protein [Ruminococcus sp.]
MEKKSKLSLISGIVLVLLSAALCVGVKLLFHACGPMEDGRWMACHWAEQAVAAFGGSMTVTAVMLLIVKKSAAKRGLALAMIPQAIAAALIPNTLISLCMMTDMRCHAVMKPAVIVISILIAVCALVTAILNRRDEQ